MNSSAPNPEAVPSRPTITPAGTDAYYRLLFDSIHDGFAVFDLVFDADGKVVDYIFVQTNPAFEKATGFENVEGRRRSELKPVVEDYWFDVMGKVALSGESARYENYSPAWNRWFSFFAVRIGGPGSHRLGLVFNDITLRDQSERRGIFLEGLSNKLAPLSTEEELIAAAVEAVGVHLRADRCYFVECLESENRIVISYDWKTGAPPSVAGTYSLYEFGGIDWWREFSSGNFSVEDVNLHPLTRANSASYAALGITSYAVQPFRQTGKWTVVLGITASVPRKWSAEEISLLEDVVTRVWPLVERARTAEALRRSEARYRTLFRSMDEGFCVIQMIFDADQKPVDWRFLETNPAFERLTGLSNVAGQRVLELLPNHEQHWFETYGRIALTGIPERFQNEARGLNKWYDLYAFRIEAPEKKQVGVFFKDITELRLGAQKIKESSERFRLLSEVVALQVWTALPDGNLDYANHECAAYFGGDLQRDVLGTAWAQYVHPEDVPLALKAWSAALSAGERYEVEFRLRRHDGVFRWFLARAEAMRDAGGEVVKWFGRNTDINDLKVAQSALERANGAKDDFLAALSHELRTPLTPVLMTAGALRSDMRLPEEVREQLGMMERNIALEARLIDDLLDLTTVSHGKLQLRSQRLDAHSLIGLAVDIVGDDARAKGITIERNLAAVRSGLVADPSRFQQVIWNLLRNAVKFTPRGGRISIRTHNESAADKPPLLRIEVRDSGIGIEKGMLEKIFRPFEQGHLTGSHRFGGLGLGLAIARAVVDLHGGAIVAQSEGRNLGATFVVDFPNAVEPQPGVGDTAKPFPNPAKPGAAVSLRILLVEDHDNTLKTICRLLQADGHRLVTASTIMESLAAAETGEFDLVVSDLGLPDGAGTDLMMKLRDTYRLRGIALSGYGMEEDIIRSRAAGFVAHLVKPVHLSELRRIIATLPPI